jgi:formate dehydrogenase
VNSNPEIPPTHTTIIIQAKNLKLCVTAGVGSDHVDLNTAVDKGIEVIEVTGSNVVSVAEHVVMDILLLVRNFVPAHEVSPSACRQPDVESLTSSIQMIERGDWQVSEIARNAYDLEGKVVGTIGAGRIGYRVLQRLLPFNCKELLYYDYNGLPAEAEKAVQARRVEDIKDFVSQCDVVTVNAPLHEGTRNLINADLLKHFKKGAWIGKQRICWCSCQFVAHALALVNTARGAICNAEDIAAALKSGQINGYAGDVWNVQPAPKDHPWRKMKNVLDGGNGMTPHYSGTTLDAQQRYASGTKEILDNFFNNKPQNPANVIIARSAYSYLCIHRTWVDADYCVQRVTSQKLMVSGKLDDAVYYTRGSSPERPLVQSCIFPVLPGGSCNRATIADIHFSKLVECDCVSCGS